MLDVDSLTKPERIFLAGCIESVIMIDGEFEDEELDELEALIETLNFDDYEECLEEFNDEVEDEEQFWVLAESIDKQETREIIIEVLHDLAIQSGIEDRAEENFINKLKSAWGL